MSETINNDFKKGLKVTSLFGGVQVFQILLSIINSKFVAVLLGPTGMGISGLLSSTTSLIGSATNFGLRTSAVRDISLAYSTNDSNRFNRVVSVFRRLVWFTGTLGLLVCALFAPMWSHLTFGNYDYTWAFVLLSVTLLLGQLSSGQSVILQGTRHFGFMAKSSIIGSVLGLFTSIPLYYVYGINGIVPAMLISSVTGICLTYYFSRKIKTERIKLSIGQVFGEGKVMMQLGVFIALRGFMETLCAYLVRIFISHQGTLEDVGLYNSGFSIIGTYVGLVFAAMTNEYYPRLSSYSKDKNSFNRAINQQMELSWLLSAPLIAIFLVMGELVLLILYSERFVGATMMISWGLLGIFFKAPSWCLGYTFMAKGDAKAFFWNELFAQVVSASLNISFYAIWGLNGLGASFLVSYVLYLVQVYFVTRIRYGYQYDRTILKVFFPQFIIALFLFLSVALLPSVYKYLIGFPLVVFSFWLSYKELNNRVDIKSFVLSKINKRKHHDT